MFIHALKPAISIGFIIVIAISCSSKAADKPNSKAQPAAVPAGLPVDVLIVNDTALDLAEVTAGSLVPNKTVDITSELQKKVSSVAFKDGSYVRQGQLLYKLDDSDIRARFRQLQVDLNLAAINERRLHELLKTETVRQEEYDIALAKLQSVQAEQDILQIELSKTSIKAPFSGLIGISKVFAGSFVTPGMSLVQLQEQSELKIEFTVPEKYLPLIKTGNEVSFTTELNKKPLPATVVSIEAGINELSRNITVQAKTDNRAGNLKAGMSARVFYKSTGKNEKGILIPTELLIPGEAGYFVFTIRNGVAKMTPVEIINRNEKDARIGSGISRGDTLMASNIIRASEGTAVTIVGIK